MPSKVDIDMQQNPNQKQCIGDDGRASTCTFQQIEIKTGKFSKQKIDGWICELDIAGKMDKDKKAAGIISDPCDKIGKAIGYTLHDPAVIGRPAPAAIPAPASMPTGQAPAPQPMQQPVLRAIKRVVPVAVKKVVARSPSVPAKRAPAPAVLARPVKVAPSVTTRKATAQRVAVASSKNRRY